MTQVVYRGNLASATWPFVAAQFGRTVIVGGPDQNFVRQLYSPEEPDKDIGVPQIYYLHNVLPTPTGFGSVGYETQSLNSAAGLTNIGNVQEVQGADGSKAYICMSDQGVGVYQLPSRTFSLLIALSARAALSTALIGGKTYFYIANIGCYTYQASTNTLTPVALAGLNPLLILGIVGSNGYLIAYTATTIAWSSTINPTDFVPSLSTGAGGGNIENLKGNIKTIVSTPSGILVASDVNAVGGVYTANARFPYQFTEVTGSGGVSSQEYVAYDTNSGNTYAYTSNGLQLFANNKSDLIFPNVTDFLAGQVFEDYDETTHSLSIVELSSALQKRIVLISSRYLVISYGITTLTHALVYDLAERRWGKLKITHADCFEYQLLDQVVSDIPKKSIAFITTDGQINTVNTDQESPSRVGVALFGKFQYVRERWLQVNQIDIESVNAGFICNCFLFPSYNGKDLQPAKQLTDVTSGERVRTFWARDQGLNHSISFEGAFALSSLIINFTATSRR